MIAPSFRERLEPLPEGGLLRDRATGLLWRSACSQTGVVFAEAVAADLAGVWRLPTVSELMEVLCQGGASLPACARRPGNVFWTSSESPSARGSGIRVVVCESGPSYAVALLERSRSARAWLVACSDHAAIPGISIPRPKKITSPPALHTVQSKLTP